jgi:hypothetical protein
VGIKKYIASPAGAHSLSFLCGRACAFHPACKRMYVRIACARKTTESELAVERRDERNREGEGISGADRRLGMARGRGLVCCQVELVSVVGGGGEGWMVGCSTHQLHLRRI